MKNNRILLALALLLPPAAALATDTIDVSIPIPDSIIAINQSGSYLLHGATSQNRIVIAPNISATITLRNATITSATASPFALSSEGCEVTLSLEGINTLSSTDWQMAGLNVPVAASITINGPTGSLTAQGGNSSKYIDSNGGAGIGGNNGQTGGNITINSGNITATGGIKGAGIGGGANGAGGNITINGGRIATSDNYMGAGIGGGMYGNGGNIRITGGNITAYGGDGGTGIGGGWRGDGGSVTIAGGTVIAVNGGGQGDPAAIGGGSYANNESVSISGGNVFAYGGNGVGIGRNASGTITISGGTVIADEIGTWSGGGIPTTISGSGTVIIAGDINVLESNYNGANVQRGLSLPFAVMQAMAANIPYGLTLHDTTHIVHEQRDTLTDTISLHDTIYLDTALLRDTVHLDTTEVHDTVHLDTVSVYDTIHLDTTELHDTLHADTTELHDTTLIVDTTFIPISVHDTTHFPISVYDTTRTPEIIIDPTLPPETLLITDTLIHDRPVDAPTYVLLEDDGGDTGAQTLPPVTNASATTLVRALSTPAGVLFSALTPGTPFALYTTAGALVVYATPTGSTYLLPSLPSGAYLLYHAGYWLKFTHRTP